MKLEPDVNPTNVSSVLIDEITNLRKRKKLHARVLRDLVQVVHELFPDWVCVSEIAQTPGGRNDAILFESGGNSICFEVFATRGQVDRDLLLLHNSWAKNKIAIVIDRDIDPSVVEAFYRKQPHEPYPVIWICDVLDAKRKSYLQLKLTQFVLGSRFSEYVAISRQLAATTQERTLRSWQGEGIDIYSSDAKGKASFGAVLSLLAVRHLVALGLPLRECKGAARIVSEDFDYIIRTIMYGVPLYLVRQGGEYSLLDFVDYGHWEVGVVLSNEADYLVVLLNPLYEELRKMFSRPLPDPGDMKEMIRLTVRG